MCTMKYQTRHLPTEHYACKCNHERAYKTTLTFACHFVTTKLTFSFNRTSQLYWYKYLDDCHITPLTDALFCKWKAVKVTWFVRWFVWISIRKIYGKSKIITMNSIVRFRRIACILAKGIQIRLKLGEALVIVVYNRCMK